MATLYLADSLAISNTQFIYLYLDVYKGEASCLTPSRFRAITSSPLASIAQCPQWTAWLVGGSWGREQDFTQLDSAQGQLGLGFIEQQVARFH